jgi:hypothetical protein
VLRALGLAAAWAASASSAQPLTQGLESCVAAIERQRYEPNEGEYLRGADTCPELAAAVGQSGWSEALHGVAAENLSAQALVSLAELASSYDATADAASVGVDSLDAVLESIREPDLRVEISLWDQFRRWLRELLGFGREGGATWLGEWLEKLTIPAELAVIIVIGIGILLLLITLGIVFNELKEAGAFGRRATKASLPDGGAALADDELRVRSIDDVRRAPVARQPGLLLVLVVETLRRYVPIAPSRTHRDLMAAAEALRATERDPYTRVVSSAERATFGGWTPAPDDMEPLLASGASLLTSLAEAGDDNAGASSPGSADSKGAA